MNAYRALRPAVFLVAIGLVSLLAAGASASSGPIVYTCASKAGTIHVIGKSRRCRRGETRLVWSLAGPAGANGKDGATGKEGPQGKEGPAGKNGAAAGYAASEPNTVNFTGAFIVGIVKKTIPAGSYLVSAKTTLVSFAPKFMRAGAFCELYDNSAPLGTSNWVQSRGFVGASWVAETTLPLEAAVTTTTTTTLSLVCSDTSSDEPGQLIEAEDSQITAVQTSHNE